MNNIKLEILLENLTVTNNMMLHELRCIKGSISGELLEKIEQERGIPSIFAHQQDIQVKETVSEELLKKTEKERDIALLSAHELGIQVKKMKAALNEGLQSLAAEYDNKARQLPVLITAKDNEILYLKKVIKKLKSSHQTPLQKNTQIRQEYNKPTSRDFPSYSNFDSSDNAGSHIGERAALDFQEQSLSIYEGGISGGDDYSEMGHDGDDY